ncbi:hypothetical protein CsSME_00042934 [Camellia sinensis var. sinensis]
MTQGCKMNWTWYILCGIGDFGILVRSGFSVSKALFFNFLSALVALAGTALALVMGQDPGQSSLIEVSYALVVIQTRFCCFCF